jgi:hypothetical protein
MLRDPLYIRLLSLRTLPKDRVTGKDANVQPGQDELEGTLRGHIGLIEESLDRLEGKATEADRGKKM